MQTYLSPARSLLALALVALSLTFAKADERKPIRVAVIGGMTMSGMWPELAAAFEADTGWKAEVVATGPKDVLSAALEQGDVDVLTMHSSDKTTDLVADGYGINLRP